MRSHWDAADQTSNFRDLDVAGAYVFVSNGFGPVHVYRKSDGTLKTLLFAGPELSGWQFGQFSTPGGHAIQRFTGEYLVVTAEGASYRAHNFVLRWVAPPG